MEDEKRKCMFLLSGGYSRKRRAFGLSIGAINRNVDGSAHVNSRGEEVGYFESVSFKLLQAHRGGLSTVHLWQSLFRGLSA